MKKTTGYFWCLMLVVAVVCGPASLVLADDPAPAAPVAQQNAAPAAAAEAQPMTPSTVSAPGNVTLDFKEADIQNVLKIISYKAGVNIVTTPDVIGNISIRLVDVPWQTALDVILKTYGYGQQKQGNIILITKQENMSKIQAEESLQTEIINLKFLDAQDAEKILIPLLSPRGKVSVLYARGQKGWKFGTFKIGKEGITSQSAERERESGIKAETISIERTPTGELVSKKAEFDPAVKSRTLIITDTASSLDRIKTVILPEIDKKPKQVLIETRIMEVNEDTLRDIGVDFGTGATGAEGGAVTGVSANQRGTKTVGGRSLASEFSPSVFGPKEGVSTFPGTEPYTAGLELVFKNLSGTQFQVIMHALEEDVRTNTLSAPRILTLDNQEASILVGFHTPILSSAVTAGDSSSGPTQTQTLDYYQEIGIRLNVVPQISEEGFINMIIHPSVTSTNSNVVATNVAGTSPNVIQTTVNYPIIDVREAQTQVLMKDGETVVLGGLLKDVKSKQLIGVPFLSKIPYLGKLFQRETVDNAKIDLLIFITAHVLTDEELVMKDLSRLNETLAQEKSAVKTPIADPKAAKKAAKKAEKKAEKKKKK